MRLIISAALAAALAACTSARPMMAPSGAQGFKIWCELPSQCYERAATVCPHGYNIEANEKDYWGLGDVDGNLFITCKSPAGAPAVPSPAPAAAPPAPAPASDTNCQACGRIGKP